VISPDERAISNGVIAATCSSGRGSGRLKSLEKVLYEYGPGTFPAKDVVGEAKGTTAAVPAAADAIKNSRLRMAFPPDGDCLLFDVGAALHGGECLSRPVSDVPTELCSLGAIAAIP
jgi:hypothetical protein